MQTLIWTQRISFVWDFVSKQLISLFACLWSWADAAAAESLSVHANFCRLRVKIGRINCFRIDTDIAIIKSGIFLGTVTDGGQFFISYILSAQVCFQGIPSLYCPVSIAHHLSLSTLGTLLPFFITLTTTMGLNVWLPGTNYWDILQWHYDSFKVVRNVFHAAYTIDLLNAALLPARP